jgi:Ca2+-binding RTX toxin-like protein
LGAAVATTGALGGTLTITDTGTAITDSLTILNSEVNSGTGLNADVYNGQNIVVNGYETVTINSGSVASSVTSSLGTVTVTGDVGGTSAETVNFTGANNVTVGVISADIVNASALTATSGTVLTMTTGSTAQTITGSSGSDRLFGNLTLGSSIDGGAGNDVITAGSGNDTVLGNDGNDTITTGGGAGDSIDGGAGNDTIIATLTAGNKIVGGDGTDVLALAVAATAATATGVSGFERLRATTTGFSQDMVVFLDNPTFTRLQGAAAGITTFSNVGASITTLETTVAGNTSTITRLVDTETNSLTVTLLGAATTTAVTVNDEETINLNTSSTGATILTTLTAADLTTLNITGSNKITIGTLAANTTTAGATLTINGADNTGGVTVSAVNSTTPASITGSFTASNVLTGTAGADTIVGGNAADTIDGGADADVLTGGAGSDIFSFTSAATGVPSSSNFDTITDFGSNSDIIRFSSALSVTAGGTIAAGTASISASGIATFNIADNTLSERLIAVANAIDQTGGPVAGETAVFQFGSDAYVFISDATNGLSATDVLIKLTGVSTTSSAFDLVTITTTDLTLS